MNFSDKKPEGMSWNQLGLKGVPEPLSTWSANAVPGLSPSGVAFTVYYIDAGFLQLF